MISCPDKQRKCQEELDTIVGRSRMPTFADWDNLPYVHATVREILRWRPVVPVGECQEPIRNIQSIIRLEVGFYHCATQVPTS